MLTLQNRGPKSLWDHGRDAKLPTEVIDYVIVGAGATGRFAVLQLLGVSPD